ncbi:MAG: (2Fe-2S) ferredoxin domain-containing protein [Ignavibacteria bacterium]|jgi:(2Fe-2S) ferredoxin
MEKPKKHIFVCAGFRVSGEAQGGCAKKGAVDNLQYLENEILDRGLDGVVVSSTGCLRACDKSPVMVIYPQNIWYGEINDEEKIDEILDALENDTVAEEYLIS